jgi:transposase InsO family protein
VHTVIDDHSRVAYAEIHDDETADTAIGVLHRAVSRFRARGVTVERVLSDNASCYKSHAWRDACAELHVKPKRTRPYRPLLTG